MNYCYDYSVFQKSFKVWVLMIKVVLLNILKKKNIEKYFSSLKGVPTFQSKQHKTSGIGHGFQKKSFKLSNFQYFYLICYQKDSIKNSQEIQISKTS